MRRDSGAVLAICMIFLLVFAAFLMLGLDYGGALVAKQQGLAASENAGRAALAKLWLPDYVAYGLPPGVTPDWTELLRQLESRQEAAWVASEHDFGPEIALLEDPDVPVAPGDPDALVVHLRAAGAHVPAVELNLANEADGDIVLGRWEPDGDGFALRPMQGPGQKEEDSDLPLAVEVVLRRSAHPEEIGVRAGGNPIPFAFGRIVPRGDTAYKNRGIGLRVAATVALVPAREIPAGCVVRTDDEGDPLWRAGAMPVAVVRTAVEPWLNALGRVEASPFEVDNGADSTAPCFFWTEDEGELSGRLAFLSNAALSGAPPAVREGDPLTPGNFTAGPGVWSTLQAGFRGCTWTMPVVESRSDRRVVGFVRVYAADVSEPVLSLAPAPSSYPRRAQGRLADAGFWVDLDPQPVRPRPFGVACALATVRVTDVEAR